VAVGTFDDEGDGFGRLDVFDVCVFVFTEGLFVDEACPSENVGTEIVDAILSDSPTNKLQSRKSQHTLEQEGGWVPFHITSFDASQGENAVLDEDIKGQGVNALLIKNHKFLLWIIPTNLILQLHNLPQLGINKRPFTLHQLFPLLCSRIKEPRINLALLILQRHIHRQNVRIFDALGHIGVTGSVIEDETLDELGFRGHAVLHFHDFNHVEVDWFGGLVDREDCVDDRDGEVFGQEFGEFGCEGGARYLQQQISVNGPFNLELFEELPKWLVYVLKVDWFGGGADLHGLDSCDFEAFCDDAGMHALRDPALCLLHQFTNKQAHGRRPVPRNLVLARRRSCNHGSRGILNLLYSPHQHHRPGSSLVCRVYHFR
jgi:hypothetical protein